jgi:uncharacterized membrane protein YkoI
VGRGCPWPPSLPWSRRNVDARVIEVEFEQQDGEYFYEFELIIPDGRLMEAIADAVTGEILPIGEDEED